ncbi:hypothetical protein SDC9_32707 [bioreactor metagenome]|uniref:Uncharacterized protein n=1 Tax=bioreactor metagenome TaxID=1076179 RepID=A0A644V6B9_9ZZZZ
MRLMKRISAYLLIFAVILSAGCLLPAVNDFPSEENLETLILPASILNEEITVNQTISSFPGSSILVPYMTLEGTSGRYDISIAKTLGPNDPVVILKIESAEYLELISHTPPDRIMIPLKYIYANNESLSATLDRLVPAYTPYTGDEDLSINILFPAEGGKASYGDVVPPWGVVRAFISSKYEVADVFVRSDSYGEEIVTPLDPYPCVLDQYPATPGNTSITLVVTDVLGNTAEQTVNFTLVRVVPEP